MQTQQRSYTPEAYLAQEKAAEFCSEYRYEIAIGHYIKENAEAQ